MPQSTQHATQSINEPVFDTRHFRQALAQFATGVTVITTRSATGEMTGLTATSFNSVSLQPPLVLWSLGSNGSTLPAFTDSTHYVINVLAADQAALATRFASRIPNRFEGVDFDLSETGQPILRGAIAWFECTNRSRYPEGDHVIFVGEVAHCAFSPKPPLLFHGGAFVSTTPILPA
ncbi:flavin reductase family protein [Actimicrobium antarcticum]|uniref:Flavin reductase family protein n=1 Tax=Actimicrobium antarcticum TaxID=1051899 RepID=A0ABP7TCM1_9BURK